MAKKNAPGASKTARKKASAKTPAVVRPPADAPDAREHGASKGELRAFFDNFVDAVRHPLVALDRHLEIVAVNRSYFATFDGDAKDVVGRSIFEVDGGRWSRAELRALLEDVIPSDAAVDDYEVEGDIEGLGRRKLVLNARRVPARGTASDHLLLAITDVTEDEERREELAERTARLSALLATVPDAVINIDEAGVIGSFSAGAERIFGYAEDEVVGRNVKTLMPEPDQGSHDAYLSDYLRTGRRKIIGVGREVTGRRKDGSSVPLMLNVTETRFDHFRVFTGVLRDLTEQKQTEEELRQARKMEVMGQLVGGVAHDFNNLLTVISGNLEMLEGMAKSETERELVADAREAAKLAATLTGQMLAFSRRQPLHPTRLDVNALVLETSDMFRRMIDETIRISTRLRKDAGAVLADGASLRAALMNLAVNARDAMPEGGELTIATTRVIRDADAGPADGSVSWVSISVADTGAGMSAEVTKRALEPFFTTKDVGEGSGLGLSMVYGFAKQSGGDLKIESAPGKGTTVTILLPEARTGEAGDASEDAARPAPADDGGEHVLLVEDDSRVRKVTARRLRGLGYKVSEAENGPAALALFDADDTIDLLFTDVVMPEGMSGADLARAARRKRPSLPVVFASGFAAEEHSVGPDELALQKPYELDELARKIREALDSRR